MNKIKWNDDFKNELEVNCYGKIDDALQDILFNYQESMGIKRGDITPELDFKLDESIKDLCGVISEVLEFQYKYNRH